MELYIARQPIFDARRNVCAYEMLFRSGLLNTFDGSDGNTATAKVISAVFGTPDGERLLDGKPAFINFPRTLLLEETASVLPPRNTVVEILESVEPDSAVQAACGRLRARGFRLALDDFVPTSATHPLIACADFLKVDFRLASPRQQTAAAARFGGQLRLLAEKVETPEEFRRAARLGYEFFQGYFFARPVVTAARVISGSKRNYLCILQELHQPYLDFSKLTSLLRHEPALSYKLLRFVNSALFARRERVDSVYHALTFIGEEAARKWLSVVTLIDLSADQPTELAVSTLVRARFAELLAPPAGLERRQEDCFLMGMFSRLDVMLGRPLQELLQGLNLPAEIGRALLDQPRPGDRLSKLWNLILAYEAADWGRLDLLASESAIKPEALSSAYTQAVAWADEASRF